MKNAGSVTREVTILISTELTNPRITKQKALKTALRMFGVAFLTHWRKSWENNPDEALNARRHYCTDPEEATILVKRYWMFESLHSLAFLAVAFSAITVGLVLQLKEMASGTIILAITAFFFILTRKWMKNRSPGETAFVLRNDWKPWRAFLLKSGALDWVVNDLMYGDDLLEAYNKKDKAFVVKRMRASIESRLSELAEGIKLAETEGRPEDRASLDSTFEQLLEFGRFEPLKIVTRQRGSFFKEKSKK